MTARQLPLFVQRQKMARHHAARCLAPSAAEIARAERLRAVTMRPSVETIDDVVLSSPLGPIFDAPDPLWDAYLSRLLKNFQA